MVAALVCGVLSTVSNAALAATTEGKHARPTRLSLVARDTVTRGAVGPESPAVTVDTAMQAGDWSTARSLAVQQRVDNPTPENFGIEGRVLEAAGDYDAAAAAYEQQLDVLGPDATAEREAAQQSLTRVRQAARGTVASEPTSTRRDDLDAQWAPKTPPPQPKKVKAPVVADEAPRERVVDKWYFWVTIGAIVASAGAVTGIAIRASRNKQPDALGRVRAPGPYPTMLRF